MDSLRFIVFVSNQAIFRFTTFFRFVKINLYREKVIDMSHFDLAKRQRTYHTSTGATKCRANLHVYEKWLFESCSSKALPPLSFSAVVVHDCSERNTCPSFSIFRPMNGLRHHLPTRCICEVPLRAAVSG